MTGVLILDVLAVLGIIVLTPLALTMAALTVVAVVSAVGDTRSKRRMRRSLDDLLRERS
jgi:hypothetical protein